MTNKHPGSGPSQAPGEKLTPQETLALLDQVMATLMYIHTQLSKGEEASAGPSLGVCSQHKIPWRKYSWGLAHPPTKVGDKWCRKKE